MPIRVTCNKCHTRFNVSDQFAGKSGPCPKCKSTIQIPALEDEVVIEAPKPKGPLDSSGRSILKPIRRKETKLSSVQITLIAASIIGFLIAALVMRTILTDPAEFPYWLLGLSAVLIAPPLAFASYAFLRDQDRGGFLGNSLWYRVLGCSAVFAITWLAYPVACFAFNDHYETATYIAAVVAMFSAGTIASIVAFEFDWLIGVVQYGLYFGVGTAGRWLAGIGAFPIDRSPATTTTTDVDVALLEPTAWQTAVFFQDAVLLFMQAIG